MCRQISKALQLDCLQKLRKEGRATLENLEERTQWLSSSKDVKRNASMAHDSFSSVDRISQRLEQLAQERRERLKELARLRTLQDEADEVRVHRLNGCTESSLFSCKSTEILSIFLER